MISKIELENFKCFDVPTIFDFGKVNILGGYNGRGKSTVIQAILLLSQSLYKHKNLKTLDVKGDFISLGFFDDLIFNESSLSDRILFGIENTNENGEKDIVRLEYQEKNDFQGKLSDLVINGKSYKGESQSIGGTEKEENQEVVVYPEDKVHPLFSEVNFVSADRKGPVLYENKEVLEEHNACGPVGENTLNVLKNRPELLDKINPLIAYIMDGGNLDLDGKGKDSSVISLKFSGKAGSRVRAINFGYGYSYVMPILVSALTVKNGILIIENPEAHLHPAAQSRLMQELVKICVGNNIQLFVETHSEHIFNALRLSVVKDDTKISGKDVSIYFFDKDFSISPLEVYDNGDVSYWPKGFFDQQENDLREILRLGTFKAFQG